MPNICKQLPARAALCALFHYDATLGVLKWRYRADQPLSWNARYAHGIAGTIGARGYVVVTIDSQTYAAHRIIWKILFDEETDEVDHRNHIRSDNRALNLRAATYASNRQNVVRRKGKSLPKGVDYAKRSGKYRARIQSNGKLLHLGFFDTPDGAHAAYAAAALKHHGEFARLD